MIVAKYGNLCKYKFYTITAGKIYNFIYEDFVNKFPILSKFDFKNCFSEKFFGQDKYNNACESYINSLISFSILRNDFKEFKRYYNIFDFSDRHNTVKEYIDTVRFIIASNYVGYEKYFDFLCESIGYNKILYCIKEIKYHIMRVLNSFLQCKIPFCAIFLRQK